MTDQTKYVYDLSEGDVSLKISLNPLVNWIWIGGTLSCLIAFLCWRKIERR